MARMTEDQAIELIKEALSGIESGGKYDALSPQDAYGKYQFIPSTWATWSKRLTKDVAGKPEVLRQTPENQEALATYKIKTLLNEGRSPQEIASIWYSGRPDFANLKGVTDAHGKYDVPGYVASFYDRFSKGAKQLLSALGPSEASAAETPPAIDYAAELMGKTPTKEVIQAAETQPNIAGVPTIDYAKELMEKQPLKPAEASGRPSLGFQSTATVTGEMPERPIVDDTKFWPLIQASMVTDPKTRIKILANARGIPVEDYFVKDGQTFYVKEGKAYPEISDSAFSSAKGLLAGIIGDLPTEIGATIGGAVGSVGGMAGGAMIGKEVQNQLAKLFFGEPQTVLGNLAEDVTAGAGSLIGLGLGKAVNAGLNKLARGRSGLVGKLAQRDLPYIDKGKMNQRLVDASDFGIDITAAEATGSPTLRTALKSVQTKPGIAAEQFQGWVDDVRIPQVEGAMEREISKVSPVPDVAEAGQKGVAAAKGAMQDLIDIRRDVAQPFYDAAKGKTADISGTLKTFDDLISETAEGSPVRAQLTRFKRMMMKTETDPDGNKILVPQDDISILDGVKKQIDKMLKGDIWAKSADKDTEYKLKKGLVQLVDELKAASPDYQNALSAFAKESRPINAFRFGTADLPADRKIPKSLLGVIEDMEGESAENAAAKLFGKTSSPSKVRLFREFVGQHDPEAVPAMVAGHLRNSLENMRDSNPATLGARFSRAVFGTPRQRKMIEVALGDQPGAYTRLKRFFELLDQTDKIIYANSETTPLAQMDRELHREAGGLAGKAAGIVGTPFTPARWQGIIENLRYPQYARAVYEMIMDPGSTDKINKLYAMPPKAKKAVEVMGILSGIIGSDEAVDELQTGGVPRTSGK